MGFVGVLSGVCFGQETSESLRLVGDLNKTDLQTSGTASNPNNMAVLGDKLYFTADDGIHGYEVWEWDGTPKGFRMLKEIFPGPASIPSAAQVSPPSTTGLFSSSGELILMANSYTPRIYNSSTDTFNPVSATQKILVPRIYNTAHGRLISGVGFDADPAYVIGKLDSENKYQPFLLPTLRAHYRSYPLLQTADGEAVMFIESNATEMRLFRTNGADEGTILLKSIPDGGFGRLSHPIGFTDKRSLYVFDQTLISTDGTPENTRTLGGQTLAAFLSGGYFPSHLSDAFIFAKRGEVSGLGYDQVCLVDPLLTQVIPLISLSYQHTLNTVYYVHEIDGKYFMIISAHKASGLYVSDGTVMGTVLLHPLKSDNVYSDPVIWGGRYYFCDSTPEKSDIWSSDGTEAGTVKIFETLPQAVPSTPIIFHDMLVLGAHMDPNRGCELYALAPQTSSIAGPRNTVQLLGVQSGASDSNLDGAVDSSDGHVIRFPFSGAK